MSNLKEELTCLLNTHNKEKGSNTPDYILSEYLLDCLRAFDKASAKRENWYSITQGGTDTSINDVGEL